MILPPGKEPVTLRLDGDVLDWFRHYQARINAVLRALVAAQPKP